MGYDIDRFESPINDGLLCCICRDVLEDPLQAPCEHAFCSTCIRGWLVHEQTCPEDRQLLFESQLRPIFRYMRNDLNQLKIRCINTEAGCGVVCKLERIDAHQEDCGFVTIPCTSTGCTATFERRELEEHLRTCSFRPRECPRGCGLPMLSGDDETHNCIAEMRNAFELMRSEMIGKIEDQKQEMELRLDLQRRHMVQKEGSMKGMVDELKEQVTRCQEQIEALHGVERDRKEERERDESEKKEMMELIRSIKTEQEKQTKEHICKNCNRSEMITDII